MSSLHSIAFDVQVKTFLSCLVPNYQPGCELDAFRLFLAVALCFGLTFPRAADAAASVDTRLEKLSERSYHAPQDVLDSLRALAAEPTTLTVDQQAFALEISSRARLRLGDMTGAMEQAERLERLGRERNVHSFECLGLLQQAYVYFQLEKANRSRELVRKAQGFSSSALSARSRVKLLLTVAQIEDQSKHGKRAAQLVDEAIAIANAQQDAGLLFLAMKMRADRAIASKDYADAAVQVDALVALARRSPYPEQLVRAKHTEYRLAYAAGWSTRAVQIMNERIRLMEDAGLDEALGTTLIEYADLELKSKHFQAAAALTSRALGYKAVTRNEGLARAAAFKHAIAKIGLGDIEKGKKEIQQLFSTAKDQFALLDELPVYIAALTDAGDTDAAVQASELLRNIDLQRILQQAKVKEEAQQRINALAAENRIRALEAAHARATRQTWQVATIAASTVLIAVMLFYWRLRTSKRQLEKLNADLYQSSNCDFLTGLYNRRYLNSAGLRLWEQSVGHDSQDAKAGNAVFLIDIDFFKRINDEHGHAVGDLVIKAAAERLSTAFGEHALVSRWGGEEFLVILKHADERHIAQAASRALAAMASTPIHAQGLNLTITMSMGVCKLPLPMADRFASWDEILYLADECLYLAKQQGKNRAFWIANAVGLASNEVVCNIQTSAAEGKLTLRALPER